MAFQKGISPKVNATSRLEVELTYYYVTAQLFNHYAKETPH